MYSGQRIFLCVVLERADRFGATYGRSPPPPTDRRVLALDASTAATDSHNQSHEKNDQENVEQNFRNSSRRRRYPGESE